MIRSQGPRQRQRRGHVGAERPARPRDALATLAVLLTLAAGVGACGGRPDLWSHPIGKLQTVGLAQSVALIDPQARRIVSLGASADGTLSIRRTPTARATVAAAAAPDGRTLYLLSAGHRATLGDPIADEHPRLTAFDDGPAAPIEIELGLTDPLDGLIIDPTGHWAVVYAASDHGTALVTNPNELVIVDLVAHSAWHHTVHSFGGRPDRLIVTPMLALPNGPAQLLIVQSQQDLALLPLDANQTNPSDDREITVRLADQTTTARPPPAEVVVDDGDPASAADARIGIRFQGDSNVMVLQLDAASGGTAGFLPSVNVTDVGGVPSAIAFVRTDGGLRLAALVPSARQAVLIDPVTTISTAVTLPAPYQRLSLVTASAGVTGGPDVALLWQGGGVATGVAFWELGQVADRPFRSIEVVAVGAQVTAVLDVPLKDAALKVLAGANDETFYVLDLQARTAAPLVASASHAVLTVSPTGARVWTFLPQGTGVASTDVISKRVRTLRADSPIDEVFEIGHATGDGRSLLAMHETGAFGATLYDVDAPDDSARRIYGGLLEEGDYEGQ